MNEAARLLRLVAPGALFVLLYGAWFVIDTNLCDRPLPQINAGGAALVAGAAIPIGFVAQVIAAEITWCPLLQERPWRPLRTINNRSVSQQVRGIREARPDLDLVGIVDVWIHEGYKNAEQPHVLNRLRSVADLYQGLGHGAVSALMAILAIVVTLVVTWDWPFRGSDDAARLALLVIGLGVCGLVSWGMCRSHQRVVRIAEVMVVETLTRQNRR